MCIRLYADMGETDLTALGINKGPAAFGGIFIKREIWDSLSALIIGNPSLIPPVPLAAPLSAQVESLLTYVDNGGEPRQGQEDFEIFEEVIYTSD